MLQHNIFIKHYLTISAKLAVVAHDTLNMYTACVLELATERQTGRCLPKRSTMVLLLSFPLALLLSFESTKTAWQWRQVG